MQICGGYEKKKIFANSKKSVHKERPIKTELINNLVMNG